MSDKNQKIKSVPSHRLTRFLHMGSLTTRIAGRALFSGATHLLKGKKVNVQDLFINEENVSLFVSELTKLRGAALKFGQLMSLDTADFLPKQLSEILNGLRKEAYFMPTAQVKKVLVSNWGPNFLQDFSFFDVQPLAAASIGQVHKAITKSGQIVAVKIQYPGIKESINSDLSNLLFLLNTTHLLPASVNLEEIINTVREQLHQETDYYHEASSLTLYKSKLAQDQEFQVPKVLYEFSTSEILVLEFMDGIYVDEMTEKDQATRNFIVFKLIELLFKEIFEFNFVQTDPNFSNFLYNETHKKIVLLDFGACQNIPPKLVEEFSGLLKAALLGNKNNIKNKMIQAGVIDPNCPEELQIIIWKIIDQVSEPIRKKKPFDFGHYDLIEWMNQINTAIKGEKEYLKIPNVKLLLVQRKIGGIFLLGKKLNAVVDINPIVNNYI